MPGAFERCANRERLARTEQAASRTRAVINCMSSGLFGARGVRAIVCQCPKMLPTVAGGFHPQCEIVRIGLHPRRSHELIAIAAAGTFVASPVMDGSATKVPAAIAMSAWDLRR